MRSPARLLLTTTTGAAASLLAATAAASTHRQLARSGINGSLAFLPPHKQAVRMASSSSSSSSSSSTAPQPKRVTIIGAAIGGLTAARTLLELAPSTSLLQLTLLEKSTSHGRCATREVPDLGVTFDHGAPGFAVATPAFRRQVDAWVAAGVVAPWGVPRGQARYYRGRPTMRSLPAHLAKGLDIRRPVLIERMVLRGSGSRWVLYPQPGQGTGQGEEWEADAVVVAVPPEQSAALLEGVEGAEALRAAIAGVKSEPCITVMLAVPATKAGGAAAAAKEEEIVKFPAGSHPVLAKAVRRRQQPGGPGGVDCWVAHTTRAFTEEYIYTTPEVFRKQAVVDAVLAAMRETGLVAPTAAPVHADAQRWLYSQTFGPVVDRACGWDAELQLGLCGDGWAGACGEGEEGLEGVERAWMSGRALGEAMAGQWWGPGGGVGSG